MLLQRFYDDQLAQASYLIGCAATGEALVIDPAREVQPYLEAAAKEGLRLTHVAETHIHADYVSGGRELAARTGATLHLSAEGGADWQYAYAAADGATLLRDGSRILVGNVRVDVLHTPGHTPEHLAFLITDTAASQEPLALFTGDFVFVGDVGRPDLLERAAHVAGTMESSARTLYRSLQRFKTLPEWVQVWPGHGAGSACGKALGALPASTVGYELRTNWALAPQTEEEFTRAVLAGQPAPPPYFAEMKQINRAGPAVLGIRPLPARLDAGAIDAAGSSGELVVDVRSGDAFADGHLPGSLSLPLNRSFVTWAGWLLPYDTDLVLVANDAADVTAAMRSLSAIGFDRVTGWAGPDVLEERAAQLQRTPRLSPAELAAMLGAADVTVLDVRNESEWRAGRIDDAQLVPLAELPTRLAEVPRTGRLVVHCAAGARSGIALGLLQGAGFTNAIELAGGYNAWALAGHPSVRGAGAAGSRNA